MGLYIKGMKMPKNCGDCWFEYAYEFCESEYEDCPLIELPPHGDLIDRDELIKFYHYDDHDCCVVDMEDISNAPTIIPEERSEE